MSDYEIEDGVEFHRHGFVVKHKTFWEALEKIEISQSFFVPENAINQNTLSTLISRKKSTSLKRFATRTETKDGIKGRRVWRVE